MDLGEFSRLDIDTGIAARPANEELWELLQHLGNANGDVFPVDWFAAHGTRSTLGRAMSGPIRSRIEYEAISREAFGVQQLPEAGTFDHGLQVELPTSWVQPGVWVKTTGWKDEFYAQVIAVANQAVSFTIWRTTEVLSVPLNQFTKTCQPCDEPKEGAAWYDRLADDEVV